MGIKIVSTGSAIPDYTVSNNDLVQLMDTSDEWIFKQTGIKKQIEHDLSEFTKRGNKMARQQRFRLF